MNTNRFFKAAWWLPGPHLQTLWAACIRRKPSINIRWETLELPDGDFLNLAWAGEGQGPIVLILHGLEGSVQSPYARGILHAINKKGWRGVLMHFRGCGGTLNRLSRSYHSGDTEDLNFVISHLQNREPKTALFAVGYSLGGNVLLKWLGERRADSSLQAAIGISVPFEVGKVSDRLNRGFSRLYQWSLLRCLQKSQNLKFKKFPVPDCLQEGYKNLYTLKSLREFDDAITAPLHGFKDAEDYYQQSSCRPYLTQIQIPTLILHARNDPFTSTEILPNAFEVSESVSLNITESGGHVGFVSGVFPWKPIYWLETEVLNFIEKHLY